MAVIVGLLLTVFAVVPQVPSVSAVLSPNPPAQGWFAPNQTANVKIASPNTNFASPALLFLQTTGGALNKARFLLQFDVSGIPSNVVVVSANLYWNVENSMTPGASDMYISGSTIAFIDVVRATGPWNQNTVTWNNQPTIHAVDFSTVQVTANSLGSPLTVPLVPMVQGWVSGSFANDGLVVAWSDESGVTYKASANFTGMTSASHAEERPYLVVQYVPPTATIYPAFYCSSGPCETNVASGTGLPPYLFVVWYSENNGTLRRAIRPDILFTNITTYFRLQVRDFWNNILYNQAHMVNAVQSAWNVSIPYALLNSYNMRDAYTNLSVRPAGGTPMIIFLPPRGWWVFPLHVGTTYYLNYTLLNANFGILGYINLTRTMPSYGLNYLVNGTSISEIRQVQNGEWQATNVTQGLAGATGNLVGGLYQFNLFKPIGPWIPLLGYLSAWMVLLFIEIVASVAWAFAYGSRVRKSGLRLANAEKTVKGLPVRANVILGVLIVLGIFLFATWAFNASGAQVLIPLPWGW